jgi:hypothetical protein
MPIYLPIYLRGRAETIALIREMAKENRLWGLRGFAGNE